MRFDIKDYPTREAQWLDAWKKVRRQRALRELTRLSEEFPGGYR